MSNNIQDLIKNYSFVQAISTGCFSFIDQEKSTPTNIQWTLHQGHKELLDTLKELANLLNERNKWKVLPRIFLNSDSYVMRLKSTSFVCPEDTRRLLIREYFGEQIQIKTFKHEGELIEWGKTHTTPFFLVKDKTYENLPITLKSAPKFLGTIFCQDEKVINSTQSNKEWLEANGIRDMYFEPTSQVRNLIRGIR